MSTIDQGGSAFPRADERGPDGMGIMEGSDGMSLREWYAGQALIGLLRLSQAVPSDFMRATDNASDRLAEIAFRVADAMIAQRRA